MTVMPACSTGHQLVFAEIRVIDGRAQFVNVCSSCGRTLSYPRVREEESKTAQ